MRHINIYLSSFCCAECGFELEDISFPFATRLFYDKFTTVKAKIESSIGKLLTIVTLISCYLVEKQKINTSKQIDILPPVCCHLVFILLNNFPFDSDWDLFIYTSIHCSHLQTNNKLSPVPSFSHECLTCLIRFLNGKCVSFSRNVSQTKWQIDNISIYQASNCRYFS